MDLSTRFLAFIQEHQLLLPHERVLLAVSGGKDSVLMAHLFAEAGFDFGIAHVNFMLRAEESALDEALVAALANELTVPYFVTRFETDNYAQKQGISIEMAARELRYAWFEELRIAHNYQYVALAHHQNDMVETMLLNLTRGTGIAGLHGILPKRDRFIRPLLFLTREEVDAAVQANQLHYRDDASNFSTQYQRNKLRWEVVPALKAINPSLEKTFAANAKRFEELNEFLQTYSRNLRQELFIPAKGQRYVIHLNKLQALYPLKTLLYELFRPYHFSAEVIGDLIATWERTDRTGKCFYSPTHRLLINRDELFLDPIGEELFPVMLLLPGQSIKLRDRNLSLQLSEEGSIVHKKERDTIAIDADRLEFPLLVRSWQEGDWFKPLGMQGKKKLSDFFISLKLPLTDKKDVPIVVNGNGDILWVVPYRMDDRCKITSETKKVAILAYR
ncbi:tRNA lysidine(34) synthetase TilS [Olivibacter ginsenosidimutans]|uniref:tRNA(Ile)-lysidine synthase n=1 Tax=Olivibacter ginsenosidimutans TaxID=1176537 RepID=A0ABP9APK0_9SPHI